MKEESLTSQISTKVLEAQTTRNVTQNKQVTTYKVTDKGIPEDFVEILSAHAIGRFFESGLPLEAEKLVLEKAEDCYTLTTTNPQGTKISLCGMLLSSDNSEVVLDYGFEIEESLPEF